MQDSPNWNQTRCQLANRQYGSAPIPGLKQHSKESGGEGEAERKREKGEGGKESERPASWGSGWQRAKDDSGAWERMN